MPGFTHVSTHLSGEEGYFIGLSDVVTWLSPAGLRVYTVSGQGGGVTAFTAGNRLQLLNSAAFPNEDAGLHAPRALSLITWNGGPALMSVGQFGRSVDVFPLLADGSLGTPRALTMRGEEIIRGAATAALGLTLGDKPLFILASRQEQGLTVWQGNGNRIDRIAQAPEAGLVAAGDIAGLKAYRLNGQDHILALSQSGNGLLNYRLGADGRLALVSQIDSRDGLAIGTGTVLEVVELAGRHYALVGAAGSGSLVVVELAANGRMILRDHVIDDQTSRFGGIQELATLTIGGQVYIAASGSDSGLSLLTLLPGGRLVHLEALADTPAMALHHPGGLALAWVGGRLEIFVAGLHSGSATGSGLTRLAYDLGTIGQVITAPDGPRVVQGTEGRDQIIAGAGNQRIEGGAGGDILVDGPGRDTLVGGAGADLFILRADGETDWILNFERGKDRLDLSDLGRFYRIEDLRITATADGADIRIGTERVILRSHDGRPLEARDFHITDLRGLTHLSLAAPAAGGSLQRGGEGRDRLEGREGPDTLIGGAGADTLIGGGGADLLIGGRIDENFDPVAAQVYRLYRATLDRAPEPAGLIGWSEALNAGQGLGAIARGLIESPEFRSTYAHLDTPGFVTLLYHNVLGRAPNAAGLADWTARIEGGLSRAQVVIGFSESPEFRAATEAEALLASREGLEMGFVDLVYRLFQATLARPPALAGLLDWSGRLAQGLGFAALVEGFTNSPEFQARYGATDPLGFVTLLYHNVLGRAPQPEGLALWTGLLEQGRYSRADVVGAFINSPEFIAKSAPGLRGWMITQGVEDVLIGGPGASLLFGGMLRDSFVFTAQEAGQSRLVGLEPWDQIVLRGFGYHQISDVARHLTMQGEDAVFADQGVEIRFIDTDRAAVLAADFLF